MKTLLIKLNLLLFILFLGNCNVSPESDSSNETLIYSKNNVRYLALGDSYTIGESVLETQRWPNQLSDSLEQREFTIDETTIIATTGWTTSELQQGISEVSPDSSYDLVSLLIGVNNQYRGYDIEIYKREFRELIDQSIALASGDAYRVFVVSIPNYGVTPFGQSRGEDRIRQELLIYDAIADSIASIYDIPFVNITPISEEAKSDPTLIAEDQLHPSGAMYTRWVNEILPIIEEKFEQ